MKHIIEQVIAK